MKTRILLLGVALFFIGCQNSGPGRYRTHYIDDFYNLGSIELSTERGNYTYLMYPNTIVAIYGIPAPIERQYPLRYGWDNNYGKDVYEALCEKHGDTSYNRYEPLVTPPVSRSNVDFTAVSIKSNADFDNEHPAETELGNIVMFHTSSTIKYIQNGYQSINCDIDKVASELTPDDLILIGAGIQPYWLATLEFISEPTIAKNHTITVTMTADNGDKFSSEVQVVWE